MDREISVSKTGHVEPGHSILGAHKELTNYKYKDVKYRHKDPDFLETRTFTKYLEYLKISILSFTCPMRDIESSFLQPKVRNINDKPFFRSDTLDTSKAHVGHVSYFGTCVEQEA